MIEKFIVSRDDSIYEAFPDVALARSGRLVCVFLESTHHRDRSHTRVMLTDSTDRGRTWSAKRPLTEARHAEGDAGPFWNAPRIAALGDGRLAAVCNPIEKGVGADGVLREDGRADVVFSGDEGGTWSAPQRTPVAGVVPDRLVELRHGPHAGRWVLSAHTRPTGPADATAWAQRCWLSDDAGETWRGPVVIASAGELRLCEGSVLEVPDGRLVCFMRENSGRGLDCHKAISTDGGESWDGPYQFPLPACHRPVAGMLGSGAVLITYRFMQGGRDWLGWWTQNAFAALTDVESCLVTSRQEAHARIMPLDFDRSPESDTGYTGWVQFADGEIYVVNYIVDDAPLAHIRGYAFCEGDIVLAG